MTRALYPKSLAKSRVQRIVVPACDACNDSWQDDEVHFRSMLLVCGQSTDVVKELWEGPVRRSFEKQDGYRRLADLHAQMVPVSSADGIRHRVYPDTDDRFLRVLRKIVRGLCYYHDLDGLPISDEQVWAGVLRDNIPPRILTAMTEGDTDTSVVRYFFDAPKDDSDLHSVWIIQFYGRAAFVAVVYRSAEAHERVVSLAE
jgi:hypothetical protein